MIGGVVFALLLALFTVNGICMLLSPRLWCSLPDWFAAHGRFTVNDYRTARSIEIRIVGAFFVAIAAVIIHGLVTS